MQKCPLLNIMLIARLAAVDMHTAQHIVKNALSGPLASDRTIILVTHHISLCLPIASYLLELAGGRVIRHGTVQELQEKNLLQKIVETEDVPVEELKPEEAEKSLPNEADGAEVVVPDKRQRSDGKLVEAEARAEGRVSMRSYMTYLRAAGFIASFLTILLLIQLRLINIGVQVCGHSLLQCVSKLSVPSSIWLVGVKPTKKERPQKRPYGGLGKTFLLRTRMLSPGS